VWPRGTTRTTTTLHVQPQHYTYNHVHTHEHNTIRNNDAESLKAFLDRLCQCDKTEHREHCEDRRKTDNSHSYRSFSFTCACAWWVARQTLDTLVALTQPCTPQHYTFNHTYNHNSTKTYTLIALTESSLDLPWKCGRARPFAPWMQAAATFA